MKMKVSNFGPVDKAEIEIKPLTIIVGKNNLGKSYLTQLIHSITSFLLEAGFVDLRELHPKEVTLYEYMTYRRIFIYRPHHLRMRFFYPHFAEKEIIEVRKNLKNSGVSDYQIHEFLSEKIRKKLSLRIERRFVNKLEQIFGVRVGKLVGLNASQSNIECALNQYVTLKILITTKNRLHIEIASDDEQKKKIEKEIIPSIIEVRKAKRITTRRINDIIRQYTMLLSVVIIDSIYIPAGRAGLLESYDTVVSALTNLSSWAPLHGISMPPIPGVASEFYNRLLSLKGRKGPFADIAETLKPVLGGNLELRKVRGVAASAPRIYYTFKKGEKSRRMDVIHAASMIKEISPLYLIIKETVFPESILIVEEPESHLHPSAQCQIVELFSQLVSKNAKVILTTHSDIVIRKIGNLVGYYKYKIDKKGTPLDPSIVAIYLLKETQVGNISKKIPIPDDGVFENIPEFDDVINELYEEQLVFQRKEQMEEE